MARYSIRTVSLFPPHFKCATTQMRLRASLHSAFSALMCFLREGCESHQNPRNFVDSFTGRGMLSILRVGGRWTLKRGAVKCTTLHLWAANLKPFIVAHSCMILTACCKCLSMVVLQGGATETECQVFNKECSEDVPGNTRRQLVDRQPKTYNSQYNIHHQLGHPLLCRIHQRVWRRFWLWWYCTTRLFYRSSPGRRKDQLPVVSVQRHPRHISRDSLGGPWYCDASWSHIGFCLVCQIFQDTRWIGCWSCALGLCTGNWSVWLVCNFLGHCGPCLVWGWGSQWLLSTDAGSLLWSRYYSGYLWGFSMCPLGDVSVDFCGSHQVQGHGVGP